MRKATEISGGEPSVASGSPTSDRGFTLVEVLIVLVMIGLLGRMAIPRLDVGRARVDQAVFQVSAHMMEAQRRAVLRQHDVRVVLDLDRNLLGIHQDADNDGERGASEAWSVSELTEGVRFGAPDIPPIASGLAAPTTFEVDDSEGQPTVVFHRNGSASETGAVYVTSSGVSAPQDTRGIRVQRATGRVRCWSYRSTEWQEGC